MKTTFWFILAALTALWLPLSLAFGLPHFTWTDWKPFLELLLGVGIMGLGVAGLIYIFTKAFL